MKTLVRSVLAVACLFSARTVLADDGGISVYVAYNERAPGRKFVRGTPLKPVYYRPVVFGYREEGYVVTNYTRRPPMTARQTDQAANMLVKGLAARGYRIETKLSPASLIITFEWGYKAQHNWGAEHNYPDMELYFLQISALDLQASQDHKRVLLWSENVVTPRWGHYIDEVLPTLIATGAPVFGGPPPGPRNKVALAMAKGQPAWYLSGCWKMTPELIPGLDLN